MKQNFSRINKPSEGQQIAMQNAVTAQLYIIQEAGVTSFVIRDTENKKYKVQLGAMHSCTCENGKKDNFCMHIAFILLRKFKLEPSNPLSFQKGLIDRDIERVLQGNVNNYIPKKKQATRPTPSSSYIFKPRNDITEENMCPICLEGFDLETIDSEPFCLSCGNTVHQQCMYMYLEHNVDVERGEKARCPYCRQKYQDGRSQEQYQLMISQKSQLNDQNNTQSSYKQNIKIIQCSCCQREVLPSRSVVMKFDREKRYCLFCFLNMDQNSYLLNGRAIKVAKMNRINAPTVRQTIYESLIYRDLSQNDYNLLLQLDNPMADASKEVLRMPGYLIPECFKINQNTSLECILCCNEEINTYNLISVTLDEVVPTSDIAIDYESLKQQLYRQNGLKISIQSLQDMFNNQKQRFLGCAQHVAHEFCLICCSVKQPVIYDPVTQQSFQTKVVPDYCEKCQIPFLKQWMRRSTLEPMQNIPQKVETPNRNSNISQTNRKILSRNNSNSISGESIIGIYGQTKYQTRSMSELPPAVPNQSQTDAERNNNQVGITKTNRSTSQRQASNLNKPHVPIEDSLLGCIHVSLPKLVRK